MAASKTAGKMSRAALLRVPWLAAEHPKKLLSGLKVLSRARNYDCGKCDEEARAAQACFVEACSMTVKTLKPKNMSEALRAIRAYQNCTHTEVACAHQRAALTECTLKRCDRAEKAVAQLAFFYNLKNIDAGIRVSDAWRKHYAGVAAEAKALMGKNNAEAARKAVFAKAEPRLERMDMARGSDKPQRMAALEAAFRSDAALEAHLRATVKTCIESSKSFAERGKAYMPHRAMVARKGDKAIKNLLAELKAAGKKRDPERFNALEEALTRPLRRLFPGM